MNGLLSRAAFGFVCGFLAASTACETQSQERGLAAPSLHTVRGRILAPDGVYADKTTVVLYVAKEDGKFQSIANGKSGFDGRYALNTYDVGRHRLVAQREGCADAATEFDVASGTGSIPLDVALAATTYSTIKGILLDSESRALAPGDLAQLFPSQAGHDETVGSKGDDGVTEYFPFTGASRLVARYDHRGIPPGGEPEAKVDIESGRFQVDVVAGFVGRLALEFRGREIEAVPWKEGDGLVEYGVDTSALAASLGALELGSNDDARFDRLRIERIGAAPGASRFVLEHPIFPMRLVGIPAGRYALIASQADSFAMQEIDVTGGDRTQLEIRREEPCSAEVTFVDVRQQPSALSNNDLDLRTPSGVGLPAVFEIQTEGGSTTVRVKNAPPGRWLLFAASAVVPVVFETGKIAKASGRIEDLAETHLQARLHDGWEWKVPSAVPVRLRLSSHDGDLLADIQLRVTIDAEGFIDVPVAAPPGWFRARVDLADLKSYDTEIGPGVRTSYQRIDRDEVDSGR